MSAGEKRAEAVQRLVDVLLANGVKVEPTPEYAVIRDGQATYVTEDGVEVEPVTEVAWPDGDQP